MTEFSTPHFLAPSCFHTTHTPHLRVGWCGWMWAAFALTFHTFPTPEVWKCGNALLGPQPVLANQYERKALDK
jgi:hypothetical protein